MRRFLALAAVFAAGCGTLSHPINDDGADKGSPTGINPGTQTLAVSVGSNVLAVGDTVTINGSLNGAPLSNNGLLTVTSSDPSVATAGGTVIFARSVGQTTINVTFNGVTASPPIGIGVVPNAAGVSAQVALQSGGGSSAFVPAAVTVPTGAQVAFTFGPQHNLVFQSVPGAPANIAQSAGGGGVYATRTFSTAGTFAFQCTIHGESGEIVVNP